MYTPRYDVSLRQAAFGYGFNGIPVFPTNCYKAPLTKHGHLDAITDLDQIKRWWDKWPDANIGIPTGPRSGILVIDVDAREDEEGKTGLGSLADLEKRFEALPKGHMVRTGGGGLHYYFVYPTDGTVIPCSVRKIASGIDVRGDGGYVLAPPSRTEGVYERIR